MERIAPARSAIRCGSLHPAQGGSNLVKLRSRLTEAKQALLASLCVITGDQTSFTRPDGIHIIALGHLRP
ncbi:MAG: hypothetical protein ACKO40_13440 [Planctomycetaceae bacterium]